MRVWVFFGGKSTEHDVSIASAYAVMRWLSRLPGYESFPVYVARSGRFFHHPDFADIHTYQDVERLIEEKTGTELSISLSGDAMIRLFEDRGGWLGGRREIALDVAFPVFHGMGGEDGSIQGMLEMLGAAYVGPGILASAVGTDKITMRRVFASLELPMTRYRHFTYTDRIDQQWIIEELGLPLFVKPARLGSTIGVSMVKTAEEFSDAVEVAFHYDTDIVIESAVPNVMELNQSVMERDAEIITSLIENPVSRSGFLTFEEKYIAEEGGTMTGSESSVTIPAPIPDDIAERIWEYSRRIYTELRCAGGAPRIDYLYDRVSGELFVNEINTIPGTLQMHLWEKTGISQTQFLRTLIDTAFVERSRRARNIDFSSRILEHTVRFAKQ